MMLVMVAVAVPVVLVVSVAVATATWSLLLAGCLWCMVYVCFLPVVRQPMYVATGASS